MSDTFDRRYWSQFGDPPRVQVDKWVPECARGLQYRNLGTQIAGQALRRTYGGGRKFRGLSSDGYERQNPK